MRFAYPWAVWSLWAIIPFVIGMYVVHGRWKRRAFRSFGYEQTIARLLAPGINARQKLKIYTIVIASFFLWLAVSGPQLGTRLIEIHRQGIDVLIAVDCSKSMLAEDMKPNRLSRAKLALSSLISSMEGDRVGIIAFAGSAFLQCPLTLDYSAAKMFLDFLDTELIPRQGTAVGEAILLAIKSFSRKERKHKVLVLITDGEDHGSDPVAAAREANREGIKILTVGIGSPEGEPIPIRDAHENISGYKKDGSGDIVMSKLDEKTLQHIALETGGKYFRATSGEIEISGIKDEIMGMEKKELQSRLFSQYENRYQFFLLMAVLLLMGNLLLPEMGRILPFKALTAALCIAVAVSAPVSASLRQKINKANSLYHNGKIDESLEVFKDAEIDNPVSPVVQYNLGNAYYKAGEFEKAYEAYGKALDAKDINIQTKSYYNMGNALYRQGKLPEAILHYRKALEFNEHDEDAKYNIEFIQKKLKETADQNKQQSQQQQQQQQQNQQNQQKDQGDNQQQAQSQQQDQGKEDQNKDNKQDQQNDKKDSGDQQKESQNTDKKKTDISKEDAERLLNSLDDQEKEAQKRRMQSPAQQPGVREDW